MKRYEVTRFNQTFFYLNLLTESYIELRNFVTFRNPMRRRLMSTLDDDHRSWLTTTTSTHDEPANSRLTNPECASNVSEAVPGSV